MEILSFIDVIDRCLMQKHQFVKFVDSFQNSDERSQN